MPLISSKSSHNHFSKVIPKLPLIKSINKHLHQGEKQPKHEADLSEALIKAKQQTNKETDPQISHC